jgi:hypothetical protein
MGESSRGNGSGMAVLSAILWILEGSRGDLSNPSGVENMLSPTVAPGSCATWGYLVQPLCGAGGWLAPSE